MKELARIIQEAVQTAIRETMGEPSASDEQLDDATQLLMLLSSRVMSAQGTRVPSSVIDAVIHHLEQADGLLDRAGLKADTEIADV